MTDTRTVIYRAFKNFLMLLAVGLFVKVFVFDLIAVHGNQMAPSIIAGDRVVMFRTAFLPLIRSIIRPRAGTPVVFRLPLEENERGCLRIAGISGDTVEIDSGFFKNSSGYMPDTQHRDTTTVVPAEFLPRDFMKAYRIPAPGDTLQLDSLELRDFFFAASAIRQEKPRGKYTLQANLFIDGTKSNDYIIEDFSLYNGRIDSIPTQYHNDWFFWDRLHEYLRRTQSEYDVTLTFSLMEDGKRLDRYVARNRFVFLLADNWTGGRDSRYFGPVRSTALEGKPVLVLWSFGSDGNKTALRAQRLGRFIR